jgi:hypothetical protein
MDFDLGHDLLLWAIKNKTPALRDVKGDTCLKQVAPALTIHISGSVAEISGD